MRELQDAYTHLSNDVSMDHVCIIVASNTIAGKSSLHLLWKSV